MSMAPKRIKLKLNAPGSSSTLPQSTAANPEEDDDVFSDDEEEEEELGSLIPLHATTKIRIKLGDAGGGSTESSTAVSSAPRVIQDAATHLFANSFDCTFLSLKSDHANRPLYISPEGSIFLEAFSPVWEQAQDFLIAIAEPVSRPEWIHEYRLTAYSLYAAVSIGLQTDDIIDVLNRLSKTDVPDTIVKFIRENTVSYGKLKLVLKRNRYFVESAYPDTLQVLLKDPVIQEGMVQLQTDKKQDEEGVPELESETAPRNAINIRTVMGAPSKPDKPSEKSAESGDAETQDQEQNKETTGVADDIYDVMFSLDPEEGGDIEDDDRVYSFEIKAAHVETVRRRCNQMDFPLIEEYDFHNDETIANLSIDLKPTTVIRPYQEKCLSKMFGNGRARSGIIVLPCGAGKTLVGITAAATIKKPTLILCTSAVSVEQWRAQFKLWSTIPDSQIARFTSDCKETFVGEAGIVISTYTMVAYSGKRSYEAQKIMDFLTKVEWGFLILDEVHVVPANVFRKVLTLVATHAKLGLTATLVREDDKITDLNFLIGPKLYEANWQDLAKKGHIANVQCAEVWCPMTPEFYREYLRAGARKRRLLYVMNPNKFRACQFLIEYHERRGDKTIVFSDDVYALTHYARTLGKPYICGPTSQTERMRVLQLFQFNPAVNTIFLSKVGDTSIDLPEATCLIQISSHYGSRRQEAQRLGRILRAKRRNDEGFNAFFYSLVSQDTQEMYYSSKRQQFLIDQGYSFKVITGIPPKEENLNQDPNLPQPSSLVYGTKSDQMKLLNDVLLATEADLKDEDIQMADDIANWSQEPGASSQKRKAKKVKGSIQSLSGADDMAYVEFQRQAPGRKAGPPKQERHKLLKKYMG